MILFLGYFKHKAGEKVAVAAVEFFVLLAVKSLASDGIDEQELTFGDSAAFLKLREGAG